jgi:hypothetical protein
VDNTTINDTIKDVVLIKKKNKFLTPKKKNRAYDG